MSTSDNNIRLQKHLIGSIIASLFCALFAAVYEAFSFGVFSYFMLFAFVFPLLGCSLPYSILVFINKKSPDLSSLRLWNSGIAALTVGSIIQGVVDIYGTTNSFIIVYWAAGIVFCALGLIKWCLYNKKTVNAFYSQNRQDI